MTTNTPKVKPDDKYELRETAQLLGVHATTVLRWTRIGLLRCSIRRINGRRVWTGKEILSFWRANC